ncbi:hypothetical protein DOTSEDRAFT_37823 [Dothistroma septosporum NZE10]|uniref:Uncharacterized protein n=1 Tax=Dothistroma septosporum (strain NZE10 / CBS 128990) TaxID=675120 RepID=N1PEQ1_DOTSN|nr:hypothetical protein DOTSEDRAFT_37823 [Dothistroma septosporum NZE10]
MAPTTPSKGAGASSTTNTTTPPASMASSSSVATPGVDSAYDSMAESGAAAFTRHMQAFLAGNGIDAAVACLFTAGEILANALEQQRERALEQPPPTTPPYVAPTPPSSAAPVEAPRRAEITTGSIPYASLPSLQKRKRVEDEDDTDYAVTKKQRTKKTASITTTTNDSRPKKAIIQKKTAAAPPPPPKVKDISYDVPAIALKDLDWSEAPPKFDEKREERIANFPAAALEQADDAISRREYWTQKYIDWLKGHVEYISFRLAAVTVMLHGANYHDETLTIGQFSINLLGPELYHIALHHFLKQTDDHDVWLHAEMAIADVVYYLRGGEKKSTRGDLFEESEKLRVMARDMGMAHGIWGR